MDTMMNIRITAMRFFAFQISGTSILGSKGIIRITASTHAKHLVSWVRRAIEKRCINIETTRDITKRQKKRVVPGADLDVCLPIMGLDYS